MTRPRTAFQTKLTEAERAAVVRASVIDGHSSRTIARMAKTGELEGVGRFEITDSYIRRLVARHKADHSPERLAREGEADRATQDARTRMLSVILGEAERWERRARAGNTDYPEHDRIMRSLAHHEKTPAARKPGQGNDQTPDTHEDAATLIAGLLARSNGTATNGTAAAPTTASLPSRPDQASGGDSA